MSKFSRSVGVLMGGAVGGQVILVAASPLLTRLYSPHDFGVLAIYVSILSIFVVVASLSYELAIPLPEEDEQAANLLVLSVGIVIAMSGLTWLLAFYFHENVAAALEADSVSQFYWLLPIGVLLGGGYKAVNLWAVREKDFSEIAKTKINQSLFIVFVQLVFFKFGAGVLIAGHAIGQGVGALRLGGIAKKQIQGSKINFNIIKSVALRYKKFPLIDTWTKLINVTGKQLPPILLAYLLSPVVAGFYALAHRVTANPVGIVTNSVSNVFFSFGAESNRNNNLKELVESTHKKLFMVAALFSVLAFIFSPVLFSLIFGKEWGEAGDYARWMSIWIAMQISTGPLTVVFALVERQGVGLAMQVQLLFIRVVALYVGSAIGDGLTAVKIYCVSSAASYFVMAISIFYVSGSNVIRLIKNYIKVAAFAFLIFSPSAVLLFFYDNNFLAAILAALGSSYYLWILRRSFR
ncbi:lipopolysaccharide biosynthesis protein [Alloalcanivorax xenomutans]|uniref:lipopolysaccharide biosynthesis protein n=1 Tax=Alloalcanivorax xenomutans TaxID=1094342 RepID=UPI0024E26BDA|nr:oligosaccharide flippase family protein [Alloalcanivorax xenomutans]